MLARDPQARFGLGEGGNIASNGRVVQELILLLAACEQASHELDQAGVVATGSGRN